MFRATIKLLGEGFEVFPEIMIPLVGSLNEFLHQYNIINAVADKIRNELALDGIILEDSPSGTKWRIGN